MSQIVPQSVCVAHLLADPMMESEVRLITFTLTTY